MKKYLNSHYDLPLPVLHIASATSSAFLADCVSNPLWVVRTRLQTEYLHSTLAVTAPASSTTTTTTSAFTMVRNIYTKEGVRAFYKGLTASFLGLPHVAIQFPLYEHFKATAKARRQELEPPGATSAPPPPHPVDIILSSIMAKVVAITITFPHEVIRIRMQDSRATCIAGQVTPANHALSITEVVRGILKHEGHAALFSGFRVNLVRVIPATVTTFLTYEYVHNFLKERESITR